LWRGEQGIICIITEGEKSFPGALRQREGGQQRQQRDGSPTGTDTAAPGVGIDNDPFSSQQQHGGGLTVRESPREGMA